ncbi:unnamed protein product [Bursaphelenchus xylophilus]|uniref:(pine wood nematode) hypothetical protein n=1 Tax=Bursaphelenchus xylophilus TaxID=6326 RepID=A0A1I7RRD9_BURXY|nr:unnamed protein product [Bursaphelenchus xylophilus]CAG9130968.1 unnamed protein product [Bursaphelenchus xylophilus]
MLNYKFVVHNTCVCNKFVNMPSILHSLSDIWSSSQSEERTSFQSHTSLFTNDEIHDLSLNDDFRSFQSIIEEDEAYGDSLNHWDVSIDLESEKDLNSHPALNLPDLTGKTPLRPRAGTLGTKIDLKSNHFPVKLPSSEVYKYSATFLIRGLPKHIKRTVFNKIVENNPSFFSKYQTVFDGIESIYTKTLLDLDIEESRTLSTGVFTLFNRTEIFEVNVKFEERLSLKTLLSAFKGRCSMIRTAIPKNIQTVVDEIIRAKATLDFTSVGAMFFEKKAEINALLGCGRELWYGFFQLAVPIERCFSVNIDLSATTFHCAQPVIQLLAEILEVSVRALIEERKPLSEFHRCKFAKEIKGLKVEVSHLGNIRRRYRVLNVTKRSASNVKFPLDIAEDETMEITVAEYFHNKYQKLNAPHLPCLQVGNENKHVYLPLEVCDVMKGQRSSKRLNDNQTSRMIKATSMTAVERERKIEQLVAKSDRNNEFTDEFGVNVSSEMVQFEGRVLSPPQLLYRTPLNVSITEYRHSLPYKGVWDMRGKNFVQGVCVSSWAMVIFVGNNLCREECVQEFIRSFHTLANTSGMYVNPRPVFCKYASGVEQVEQIFQYLKRRYPNLQLLCAILPGKSPIYAELKRVGDTVFGIPTQCVKLPNVLKISAQTISNICLKVNSKLGGINSIVAPSLRPSLFNEPVVFMGARVIHSGHDDFKKRPSIAAVVGSIDGHPCKYAATVRTQQREEFIVDMAHMVRELLVSFYKNTGFKPVRIVMFRDGISQSQTLNVLRQEIIALRKALLMLEKDYNPGITYISVERTHHTRLFAVNPNDRIGRASNVPPGTVVDTTITQQDEYDFYLCSHAGIQGTSRPAHYHVLWDDNKISCNDLQTLIYHLCHTYARCTRSISIPAPAYYAHLVASRARLHLQPNEGCEEQNTSGEDENENINKSVTVHEDLANTMYFT